MKQLISNRKRERIIYWVILTWSLFAVLAIIYKISFIQLGTYFGALTLFVGNYIIAETKRASSKKGWCTSRRELLTYIIYFIWIVIGILAIVIPKQIYKVDLAELSVYFTSLSGFIGAYIWGETMKEDKK